MDEAPYRISRYLDEPVRLMLWSADEWIAWMGPLVGLYVMTGGLLWGLGVGGVALFLLKKFKSDHGLGYGRIWWYWYFPEVKRWACIPPSYVREYLS